MVEKSPIDQKEEFQTLKADQPLAVDWNLILPEQSQDKCAIKRIPASVLNKKVFMLLSSRELFKIRGVCSDWSDSVKSVWCQVVKDEMLEQVHSLDLLYEKETTSKLLEFKLKYLVSYATLMNNYFAHMNFDDIVAELLSLED